MFSLPILLLATSRASQRSETRSKASDTAQATAANSETDLICGLEYPTGSNIPRRVCRTPEEMDEERAAAQEWMRSHEAVQNCRDDGTCPKG